MDGKPRIDSLHPYLGCYGDDNGTIEVVAGHVDLVAFNVARGYAQDECNDPIEADVLAHGFVRMHKCDPDNDPDGADERCEWRICSAMPEGEGWQAATFAVEE